MLANSPPAVIPTSTWPRLWKQDATRFVGIDVGVDRVQVASVCRTASRTDQARVRSEPLVWTARNDFALPVDPFRPPTPSLVNTVCETLRARLPRCVDGERQFATIALPMPWIHYETTLPEELGRSQTVCDSMFGGSVFQSTAKLSHWPVCDGKEQQVVAATSEIAACRIAEVVKSVGYRVQSILPHGVALLHAAQTLTSLTPQCVVLLELYGGLVATPNGNQCGLCRALPASQRDDPRQHVDQLEPWLEEIATEVTATMRYVARLAGRSNSQGPVLIAGSVAQIDGVAEVLATMLDRSVAVWRYTSRNRPIGAYNNDSEDIDRDPHRAVALSLAHCSASRFAEGGH